MNISSLSEVSFLNGFITFYDKKLPATGKKHNSIAMSYQAELMHRGYMLTEEAYDMLCNTSNECIINEYNVVLPFIDDIIGNGDFKPLFEGFPMQVMETSEYELFVTQIMHYWTNGAFQPENKYPNRGTAFERTTYKMISYGTHEQFMRIFTTLTSSPVALSGQDLDTFNWFIGNVAKEDLQKYVSPNIGFKELMCKLVDLDIYTPATVTDVLRYAVFLSDGDVSLPPLPKKMIRTSRWSSETVVNPEREKFKFKKFDRKTRTKILRLFESSNLDVREMKPRANSYIRLGEILHPMEKRNFRLFPRTANAFDTIRNEKVVSWYGEVDACKTLVEKINKLKERPGEFARRLDHLIRSAESVKDLDLVLNGFLSVAGRVSMKVLFELYRHFENRHNERSRKIFIKSSNKPHKLPVLPAMSKITVDVILNRIVDAIKNNYSMKESLKGKYFIIDESLKNLPIPVDMRHASDSLSQKMRGQKELLDDKETVRFFVHWTDNNGTKDVDLSAVFIGDDHRYINYMAYSTNKRTRYACHSGDVRHRAGNCAEYIDVHKANAMEEGIRYVIVTAYNFDSPSFENVNGVCGFMTRDYPDNNRTWLPSTLNNTLKLNGESGTLIMSVIDLKENKVIYIDMPCTQNLASMSKKSAINIFSDIENYLSSSISVYDIVSWNVTARDGIILTRETFDELTKDTDVADIDVTSLTSDDFSSYKQIFDYML